jgi:uncharacterized cupredoxin-like copper-binding protein
MLRVVIAMSVLVLSVLAIAGCTRRVEAGELRPLVSAGSDGSTVVNVTARSFVITPDTTTIPAGKITFKVTNTDVITHETLVVHAQGTGFDLPYDFSISRVIEDQIDKPGEVPDIQGGTSGEVTLDLEPGTYVLMCNLTAHFQAGMHTLITVTPHK